jgi:hypothetical protein
MVFYLKNISQNVKALLLKKNQLKLKTLITK